MDRTARVCSYPHALFFLDLLQSADFRAAVARTPVKVSVQVMLAMCRGPQGRLADSTIAVSPQEMVHTQQFRFWLHFRANRAKANAHDNAALHEPAPA